MSFFTVQVKPPVLNWSNPQVPDLVAFGRTGIIASGSSRRRRARYCKGMPAKIVPPLGMACRADLSWDPIE